MTDTRHSSADDAEFPKPSRQPSMNDGSTPAAEGLTKPLSDRDTQEVAERLTLMQADSRSLPAGLRAAAAEATRRDVAKALSDIADQIEEGASLPEAVRGLKRQMSPLVEGAFAAAAESPVVGGVLFEILEHQNAGRWRQRNVVLSLAYPMAVLVASVSVFCGIQLTVVRQFAEIFVEFQMNLPMVTLMGLWWSETGAWMLLAMMLVITGSLLIGAWFASRQGWHRFLGAVPMFGGMWRLGGHSEMTRLLSMLLAHEIPAPRAILLASQCCTNWDVAAVWREVADHLEAGASFAHAVGRQHRVPAEVVTFSHWGEQAGTLDESLKAVSDLLEQQSHDLGGQVQLMLPPILFGAVMVAIGATVTSMFVPMATLLGAMM